MSDFNTVSNNEFMIEKIKERPINQRKLIRRLVITVSMAVIFGLVACVTILLLEPVISNWLYPAEDPAPIVIFPEEEEEMQPEDMLADKLPENQVKEEVAPIIVQPQLDKEQVDEILNSVELDKSHYVQLYQVMSAYVNEIEKSTVIVTGVKEDHDWLENSYKSKNQVSGLVIANNMENIYILTYIQPIKKADKIQVEFQGGKKAEAKLLQKYTATDMAVLTISADQFSNEEEVGKITPAVFGSSRTYNMVGSPVVALGSPVGIINSVEYGMVTAVSEDTAAGDFDYDLLTTDIYGSPSGRGFLFNMNGQVIGILTSKTINADIKNSITAYGISDLKKLITLLSSGRQLPYLGIKGISVTKEANEELQIPYGAYVTDVVINSPAMMAGLQEGDIIIGMDEEEITDYDDLEKVLYNSQNGQFIHMKIMRQSQDTYKEMSMEVILTGAE